MHLPVLSSVRRKLKRMKQALTAALGVNKKRLHKFCLPRLSCSFAFNGSSYFVSRLHLSQNYSALSSLALERKIRSLPETRRKLKRMKQALTAAIVLDFLR